ncbi:MAG TPA: hypothetical protein VHV83_09250, partial [Armatimonadota bacterium]|nr:hypothetical protein [Armatimonadota bacterium]
GVDLLLDADDGGTIQPILLEANGRPAGMGHSRFITPDGPTDEPGVTMHLWQRIRITQKSWFSTGLRWLFIQPRFFQPTTHWVMPFTTY